MSLIYIDKNLRKILIFFFSVIILIGSILLLKAISKNKYVEKKQAVYTYSHQANVGYNVYIVPNPLIEEKVIGQGNTYITEYIDNINTVMRYNFSANKEANIKGHYEIIAKVEGFTSSEKDSKSIWSKEFILQPKTDFAINDKTSEIKNELPIKINDYNDLIQQANKNLGINFTGKLSIVWNISINGKTKDGLISEQLSPKMEIPLNEKFFQIAGNLNQDKKGQIDKTKKIVSTNYKKGIGFSSFFIIIGIMALVAIFLITIEKDDEKPTNKKVKKILKNYEERLVAINQDYINENDLIISVATMDDLIKIADEIEKPIFYKASLDIEDIRKFYIMDNGIVYIFEVGTVNNNLAYEPETVSNN